MTLLELSLFLSTKFLTKVGKRNKPNDDFSFEELRKTTLNTQKVIMLHSTSSHKQFDCFGASSHMVGDTTHPWDKQKSVWRVLTVR